MKNNKKRASGQAASEALVTVGVMGMLLLSAVALYQLLNADLKANKAARLAAWHGTLYQGLSAEQLEEKYRENIRATIFDDHTTSETEVIGRRTSGRAQILGEASEIEFQYDTTSPTYSYPSIRSSYIATLAGLNEDKISTVSVSLPLGDILIAKSPDNSSWGYCRTDDDFDSCSGNLENSLPGYDPIADAYRLNLRGKAALLSNGFVPINEDSFSNAIANISADGGPLGALELLRRPLSLLGFDEIDITLTSDGLSTVADEQSRIMPPQLGTFE